MTRRDRAFAQVDVFTDEPLRGNPVAVCLDGVGLSDADMQRLAAWTNLSETTFVLPPTDPAADYRVRIFTGAEELPFAGHPTLGTAHAWLAAGGRPRGGEVIQECGLGLVRVRHDEVMGRVAFAAPERRRHGPLAPTDLDAIVEGLGLDPASIVAHQWCDNGPPWQALLLDGPERVLAIDADRARLGDRYVGVAACYPAGADVSLEVRAFCPGGSGPIEDPVTGSLNAALGQWLIAEGRVGTSYVAAQGTCLDRAGRVHVELVDETVWVGGSCRTVIEGQLRLA